MVDPLYEGFGRVQNESHNRDDHHKPEANDDFFCEHVELPVRRSASEACGIIRVPVAIVLGHLRISADGPRHHRVATAVLGSDDLARPTSLFYPGLKRIGKSILRAFRG